MDVRTSVTMCAAPGEFMTTAHGQSDRGLFAASVRNRISISSRYPIRIRPSACGAPYDQMFRREDMQPPATFPQNPLPDWAEKMPYRRPQAGARGQLGRSAPPRHFSGTQSTIPWHGEVYRRQRGTNFSRALRTTGHARKIRLILFQSDHGPVHGRTGIYFKNGLYETAHRVACMLRWPARIRPGTVMRECVANVDLLPTLAGPF